MKQTTLIAIVLGILVVISAVQAVQLSTLKAKIENEGLNLKEASSRVKSSAGSGAAIPSNIDSLPQMVGGC